MSEWLVTMVVYAVGDDKQEAMENALEGPVYSSDVTDIKKIVKPKEAT